jgi:hypothetical protein
MDGLLLSGGGKSVDRILKPGDPEHSVMLLFRDGIAADAPFVMIQQNPAGEFLFSRRETVGGEVENASSGRRAYTNAWLKLVRQGSVISGYVSDDGVPFPEEGEVSRRRSASMAGRHLT